jgi:hypothetical protein
MLWGSRRFGFTERALPSKKTDELASMCNFVRSLPILMSSYFFICGLTDPLGNNGVSNVFLSRLWVSISRLAHSAASVTHASRANIIPNPRGYTCQRIDLSEECLS